MNILDDPMALLLPNTEGVTDKEQRISSLLHAHNKKGNTPFDKYSELTCMNMFSILYNAASFF